MQTIELVRLFTLEEAKPLINTYAPARTANHPRFTDDTLFVDAATGAHVACVFKFPGDLEAFRKAVLAVKVSTVGRAAGVRTRSSTFGAMARSGMRRRNACTACALSFEQPDVHAVIAGAAPALWKKLTSMSGQAEAATRIAIERVLPAWRMGDSPYTSGVVNRTAALAYHLDRNNFDGAWSVMPSIRRFVRGGYLHMPEWGLTLPCNDGDVLGFPGSTTMHGVTPLAVDHAIGSRYTVVYYPVKSMARCLEPGAEVERARATRTAGEDTQIERQRAAGLLT